MEESIRALALAQTQTTARHLCPNCSAERKNRHDTCLSVTVDGDKYLYACHHCSFSGAGRLTERRPLFRPVPAPTLDIDTPPMGDDSPALRWLMKRGITRATALQAGIIDGVKFIDGERRDAIGFPYREAGKTYAVKWRALDTKGFVQSGSANTFWMIEDIAKGDVLVATEGEADTLALRQAGIKAVSVPNGAPSGPIKDGDRKFGYLWKAKEIIEAAPKIIIAVDNDEPGQALGEEIARRIGRAKCWRASWPESCKDANDTLVAHGPDVLRDCIENAEPWPVKGLYDTAHFMDKVTALYDRGLPKGESTGFPSVDELYTVLPGQLTIATGTPGSGKSTFIDNVMISLAKTKGWRFAVCSFENPPEVHIAKLAAIAAKTPFFDGPTPRMDKAHRDKVLAWVQDHFYFLHRADGSLSSLEDIIDLTKAAIMRYGIRGLVVDPYNYLYRGETNETDWVSDALTKLKVLAMGHDIHVTLAAHPVKMRRKDDGTFPVPTGYDIAGCYSDDTEVLTKRGWLKHADISLEDSVACFDPTTHTMAYHPPERIIRKEYSGPVHHLKGYGYDLLVTPEHRLVVEPYWQDPVGTQVSTGIGRPTRWQKGKWTFCQAADLPGAQFNIPLAAPLVDKAEDTITENLARLAGWYVSEGSKISAGASISQAFGDSADQIEALLAVLCVPYKIYPSGPGGKGGTKPMKNFYIGVRGARELVGWLHKECKIGSANKRIPAEIMAGSPAVKRAFLETYLLGDGSTKRSAWAATTTSPGLRDDLQRLCLEIGHSCSWNSRTQVSANHSPSWQLNICRVGRDRTALQPSRNMMIEEYTGTVWCLTVPTGAYFVRRNGKALACGNSAHFSNKADMGITLHRPDMLTNETEFSSWKVRFSFSGKIGKTTLLYDAPTGAYFEKPTGPRYSCDES